MQKGPTSMRKFNLSAFTASTVAIAIASVATPAFAQSTGSQDFDKPIIVKGRSGPLAVEGVSSPDSTKAKAVLTQEIIANAMPGQTILDTINLIPGVSFQNNDAYGAAGGTLNIRGFDASRVALLQDGIPLNDTGNYALYANQQLDSELISQVQVNIGSTDVDSPTPSAVGGTINYLSKDPDHQFGARISGTIGEQNMMRVFGKIESGDLNASGTRFWVAASKQTYDNPFNNYGKLNKQQFNGKIYQPLGSNGDFISVSAHWNQNRNNFFGSLPLRWDTTQSPTNSAPRIVGSASSNRFPTNSAEASYLVGYPCNTAAAVAGTADATNTCGTEFDRRYNPSDTGNIRVNSKFHLAPNIVLTVDPFYQYVKANGGGTVTGLEQTRTVAGTAYTGFMGGSYYFGKDLNGDGDVLDRVTLVAPSQTGTNRFGVSASLKWDITPNQAIRVAYSYDRGRHKQTGETNKLLINGEPMDVFPINNGLTTSSGLLMEKRDRLSMAILHQVAAEYRGKFLDNRLTVSAGVRAPFFRRNLTNHCFTTSATGNVDCVGMASGTLAAYAAANPYAFNSTTNVATGAAVPQQRVFDYNKVLPNLGVSFDFIPSATVFANYSKGLSVPGTDNLYNAFYFPLGNANATPTPETTDNFDLGLRYRSSRIQAQFSGFYTQFQNRLVSAYDPVLDRNVYRNLGNVKKYGIDGYVSFDIIPKKLNLYLFGSLLKSEIQNDLVIGRNVDGSAVYDNTAGKFESGAPKSTLGVSLRGHEGPFSLGITAKRTGQRYVYDDNAATYVGSFIPTGSKTSTGTAPALTTTQTAGTAMIFPSSVPAYWLVHLDAKVKLDVIGLNDKSYLSFNVYNLFNQFYVGGYSSGLSQAYTANSTTGVYAYGNPINVQIGAPRTMSASVSFAF
jgi:iron complex outermembrane receptor protein